MRIVLVTVDDLGRARELFLMMAEVFETECEALGDEYLACCWRAAEDKSRNRIDLVEGIR